MNEIFLKILKKAKIRNIFPSAILFQHPNRYIKISWSLNGFNGVDYINVFSRHSTQRHSRERNTSNINYCFQLTIDDIDYNMSLNEEEYSWTLLRIKEIFKEKIDENNIELMKYYDELT